MVGPLVAKPEQVPCDLAIGDGLRAAKVREIQTVEINNNRRHGDATPKKMLVFK